MKRLGHVMGLALLALSCSDRYVPGGDDDPRNRAIGSIDEIPATFCDQTLMVQVRWPDSTYFCMDAFEASLDGGARGNAHQANNNDLALTLDGSTTAKATVGLHADPATGVSWYQAKAACENAGKRLCTLAEWERACRGPGSWIYPYGDLVDQTACNGFYNFSDDNPLPTGSLRTCGSYFGAFDLSGNLSEWTDTPAARVPGSDVLNDRAVRGGSYNGNDVALRCVGEEYRDAPSSTLAERGFRCCDDP
jgi:formylglycine-generating enzyme required for sulfatase activity